MYSFVSDSVYVCDSVHSVPAVVALVVQIGAVYSNKTQLSIHTQLTGVRCVLQVLAYRTVPYSVWSKSVSTLLASLFYSDTRVYRNSYSLGL